jgi:hypothetical protein
MKVIFSTQSYPSIKKWTFSLVNGPIHSKYMDSPLSPVGFIIENGHFIIEKFNFIFEITNIINKSLYAIFNNTLLLLRYSAYYRLTIITINPHEVLSFAYLTSPDDLTSQRTNKEIQ